MATRYFLIQMERGPDQPMRTRMVASWRPRHVVDLLTGVDEKYESMGNARRFVLARCTASDAKLDTFDNLPGVVELPDAASINPGRLTRIEAMCATRGIGVELTGATTALEVAQRIQTSIQALVANETPSDRAALAAIMLGGG